MKMSQVSEKSTNVRACQTTPENISDPRGLITVLDLTTYPDELKELISSNCDRFISALGSSHSACCYEF